MIATDGWGRVVEAIELFRRAVESRVRVEGASLDDMALARDRILDAVRALPDRRERIATAAMQGLLASDHDLVLSYEAVAGIAVKQADALISALDAKKVNR